MTNVLPCDFPVSRVMLLAVLGLSLAISDGQTRSLAAAPAAQNMEDKGAAGTAIGVVSFLPQVPVCRSGRPIAIAAVIENAGDAAVRIEPRLTLPQGVRLLTTDTPPVVSINGGDQKTLLWKIQADAPMECQLSLTVNVDGASAAKTTLPLYFLPLVEQRQLPYIPDPQPALTSILVGAHHCPLWEADKPGMWANLLKHPERTPALGFYSQENPQVADWETKWATEHGISYFIYCWYRASQGGAVKMNFGSAIHDALFKSRFVGKMKFTIMWENQARGTAGVADERDLMVNLLPYWIDNYFTHPSYLKIDNKPVLFIYRPEMLVKDLGSVQNVKKALDQMRQACRDRGFAGLYILGEYRGVDPNVLKFMKQLGLDYTFAYCWHIQNNPTPQQAIAAQMQYITKTQELAVLPQVVTVSQAWSGWADEGSIWKIPPKEFKGLLQQAKDFIATLPAGELGSRMLLLDNWNEWGEGHYIAPYREYGFGYLDAVRQVFSTAAEPHIDLLPEDIGFGPYDAAYRTYQQRQTQMNALVKKKVNKAEVNTDGLIGWWAFDEQPDNPVALDYSGHRLGGVLHGASRATGIDGNALVCQGGGVVVENHAMLSPTMAMTLECWVKTDVAGQHDKWFINRIFGGRTDTGYRMGLHNGKPCFAIPRTNWSDHLAAEVTLPTAKWVHLAGTFDGKVMRIYIDGQEHGSLPRPGPIKANQFRLCLGVYDVDHKAHFTGLLDEVKLYGRALSPDEIRQHSLGQRGKP